MDCLRRIDALSWTHLTINPKEDLESLVLSFYAEPESSSKQPILVGALIFLRKVSDQLESLFNELFSRMHNDG